MLELKRERQNKRMRECEGMNVSSLARACITCAR